MKLWVWGLLIWLFLPGCPRENPAHAPASPRNVPAENLIRPKITPTPIDLPSCAWGSARMTYNRKTRDYRLQAEIFGNRIDKNFTPGTNFTAALETEVSRDEKTGLFLYRYRLTNFKPGPAQLMYLEFTCETLIVKALPEPDFQRILHLGWCLERPQAGCRKDKALSRFQLSGLPPGESRVFCLLSPDPPGIIKAELFGSGETIPDLSGESSPLTLLEKAKPAFKTSFSPRLRPFTQADRLQADRDRSLLRSAFVLPQELQRALDNFCRGETFERLAVNLPAPNKVYCKSREEFLLSFQLLNHRALKLGWVSPAEFKKVQTRLEKYRRALSRGEGRQEIASALQELERMKAGKKIRQNYYCLIKGNLQYLDSLEAAGWKACSAKPLIRGIGGSSGWYPNGLVVDRSDTDHEIRADYYYRKNGFTPQIYQTVSFDPRSRIFTYTYRIADLKGPQAISYFAFENRAEIMENLNDVGWGWVGGSSPYRIAAAFAPPGRFIRPGESGVFILRSPAPPAFGSGVLSGCFYRYAAGEKLSPVELREYHRATLDPNRLFSDKQSFSALLPDSVPETSVRSFLQRLTETAERIRAHEPGNSGAEIPERNPSPVKQLTDQAYRAAFSKTAFPGAIEQALARLEILRKQKQIEPFLYYYLKGNLQFVSGFNSDSVIGVSPVTAEPRSCGENLHVIGIALENFYRTTRYFPLSAGRLIHEGYLTEWPVCPIDHLYYGYEYDYQDGKGCFTVFCRGSHDGGKENMSYRRSGLIPGPPWFNFPKPADLHPLR